MKDDVLRDIVLNATNLTRQNKLKWTNSDNTMSFFTSKIGNQKLEIFNTGIRYGFQISDMANLVIGSLTEEAYVGISVNSGQIFSPMNNLGISGFSGNYGLKTLFDVAKSSVIDVDKRLYDLLDAMKKM